MVAMTNLERKEHKKDVVHILCDNTTGVVQ